MKYTREQLQKMAQQWIAAKSNNDPRADEVVMWCAVMAGMGLEETEKRIRAMAK